MESRDVSRLLETAEGGASLLRLDDPRWAGVQVRVTTRVGGVSRAPYDGFNLAQHVGDDPAAVHANRARLRSWLPGEPAWLEQVHGTEVLRLGPEEHPLLEAAPGRADAATACATGQVLAVMTADCLPVVLADVQAGLLGVAHAGWRGLAAGVLENAVAAMAQQGADPSRMLAWVGPAIGPNAFEVGDDVRHAMKYNETNCFIARPDRAGKWWCDLPALARLRLRALGLPEVGVSGLCTVDDTRFYSYRRDGITGRFATLAWLDGC